ncbi:LysR family transcriptional regulator [Pseudonocardia oroxyli]|uniref:Transcriptional regulator, LysR family n=1 Tax=Pseudonocardia oroxyli TaxID=366584 RepID=A0A1G7JEE2_PSEOR|nr:LysR family transcriptional regulator [Pseudonocardia oroxyli]SDF23253.1 transcriptional regulator, LysR family [Pseudonocardia oroxyli]
MELSLTRLRMLRELYRRGTVTAAAASLHYTASAVSQQLAQLEREVGGPLFERLGRRVRFTELGLVLTEHAEEILGSVERAELALEEARDERSVRLTAGVWASVTAGLLPAALARLAQDHPGITVSTRELAPEETAGAVRDGALDFSFVIDYSGHPMSWDPSLTREVVAVERLYAALPEAEPHGPTVELGELADRPWILAGPRSHFGRAARNACRRAGFEPRTIHQAEEQFTALALVAGGHGVTLVSDLGLANRPAGVATYPLAEPVLRTVSIAYRTHAVRKLAMQHVVDAVRRTAEAHGLGEPVEAARLPLP